jgi:hypothetical protein
MAQATAVAAKMTRMAARRLNMEGVCFLRREDRVAVQVGAVKYFVR